MTVEDITLYCQLLPPYARFFDVIPESDGVGSNHQRHINRQQRSLSDPAFGWHFVKTLVECDSPPLSVFQHVWLRRAYAYEKWHRPDSIIEATLGLASTRAFQYALQALLIHEDYSLTRAAETLGLKVKVVEAYEQLFFNIRDRIRELKYRTDIIWPNTRYAEGDQDYYRNVGPRLRLLQTSLEHGPEKALAAAGYNDNWANLVTGPAALQETLRVASRGANLALWGVTGGNTNNVTVKRVFNLVIAQAQSGAPPETSAEQSEVSCLGVSMQKTLQTLITAGTIDVEEVPSTSLPPPSKA